MARKDVDKAQLLKKQKRQMEKIKVLMKKLSDYEESGMANVASLNLNYEEREVIKRALACHLMFLQVDSKQIQETLNSSGTNTSKEGD